MSELRDYRDTTRYEVYTEEEFQPIHEYDIFDTPDGIKLYRSSDDNWADPGGLAGTLKDTDGAYKIKLNDLKLKLDYQQVYELLVLLTFVVNEPLEIRNSKPFKRIDSKS